MTMGTRHVDRIVGVSAQSAAIEAAGASGGSVAIAPIAPEEAHRADLYDFLAGLLAKPPSAARLEQLACLETDDSEIGQAISALKRLAQGLDAQSIDREFHALFIGIGRGELLPYGSYYLTGFLNEKPLALLREDMARLKMARTDTVYEPEDNIASLCEMMAGLIRGRFDAPVDIATQKKFFDKHIGPWAGHFFSDLERAEYAVFYAPVGTLGRLFTDIEAEAFRMAT